MTVSDLLSKLGNKAGLNMADPKFANLLAINTEFPLEEANKIMASLLTIEDAKQNFDLKNWFFKSALDGADKEMNSIMTEMGLELADKEEINAEKSTYQRIGKLLKKIQDLEKKKSGAGAADKVELQKQINDATSKIADLQKNHGEEIKRTNSEWQSKLTTTTIKSILAGKKYANKDIPQDVNVETAMVLLNRELEKSGAKIVNQNGILTLKQSKDESLDWLNSANEKPSFEQFVDGTLATLKLLAVNDSAGTPTPPGNGFPPGNPGAPHINGGGNPSVNHELVNSANADFKALEDALKQ